jgi:hypothetical protein
MVSTPTSTKAFQSPRRSLLRPLLVASLVVSATALSGCGLTDDVDSRPMQKQADGTWSRQDPNQRDTIFGKGGIDLFGGNKQADSAGGGAGIGVNAFLWRAALDTVSFMPLASADPFGGVIISDWYQPQNSPNERFKVNLYILGRDLRADGLKASVFRQVRDQNTGSWLDAATTASVNTEFENAVLTRARQLRMAAANADR